jgi:hypothetical protein
MTHMRNSSRASCSLMIFFDTTVSRISTKYESSIGKPDHLGTREHELSAVRAFSAWLDVPACPTPAECVLDWEVRCP